MAKKEINSDISVDGQIMLTNVPNGIGNFLTYNLVNKAISQRTNAEVISDLGLITATNIASAYYTKTQLQTSGQAQVHWGNLTNVPITFTPSVHNHDDRYYTETESNAKFVPYTGATQDLQLVDRNLYFQGGQIQFFSNAKLYHGRPIGSSSAGLILWGYDGIEFANRSYYNSPTIFTMNGVEKARVQYNGDFKNEGVLLPQKGIIVKGFSPIVKQKRMEFLTSLIFIKTGFGESYSNMTEFKVILKTYSTSGLKHYEFIISNYFYRDSEINHFPSVTWVAGNSTDITSIKFYKKDSGGYESYVAIEGSFDYPQVSITEAQVAEGASNTLHPDYWSIDFAQTADLTGKSVTHTFLPNDFKRDKTWLEANYFPKSNLHGISISNTGGGAWINMPTGGFSAIGSGGQGVDAWIAKTASNGQFFIDAIAGDLICRNTTGKIMWGNTSSYAGMYLQNNILTFLNTPKVGNNDIYHSGNFSLNDYATQTWVTNQGYITANDVPPVYNGRINYTGVGAIEGGGTSTANQSVNTHYSFDLTQATKDNINKGVTAYDWGNHRDAEYGKIPSDYNHDGVLSTYDLDNEPPNTYFHNINVQSSNDLAVINLRKRHTLTIRNTNSAPCLITVNGGSSFSINGYGTYQFYMSDDVHISVIKLPVTTSLYI